MSFFGGGFMPCIRILYLKHRSSCICKSHRDAADRAAAAVTSTNGQKIVEKKYTKNYGVSASPASFPFVIRIMLRGGLSFFSLVLRWHSTVSLCFLCVCVFPCTFIAWVKLLYCPLHPPPASFFFLTLFLAIYSLRSSNFFSFRSLTVPCTMLWHC